MSTRVRSHSKINLGLAIGPLRPDGFHTLTTVYQTLAIHDIVTVTAHPASHRSITLSCNHPGVPTDASNTAWRMVERVLDELYSAAEVHIDIEKRLPVQGGLGAGSANAVAALIGLEHELGRRIGALDRWRLAEEIGSDVPLFLLGGSVLGVGRGEEVYPLPDIPSLPCVLAIPSVGVSTSGAYREWDRLHPADQEIPSGSGEPPAGKSLTRHPLACPTSLTWKSPSAIVRGLSRSIASAFGEPHSSGVFSQGEDLVGSPLLSLVRAGIENDFEEVVFSQHPFLGEIKRIVVGGSAPEEHALYAALSGSGSALFGLYRTPQAAKAALVRLESHGVPGVLTSTLPRGEYWDTMLV